jgi:hypothetical protein
MIYNFRVAVNCNVRTTKILRFSTLSFPRNRGKIADSHRKIAAAAVLHRHAIGTTPQPRGEKEIEERVHVSTPFLTTLSVSRPLSIYIQAGLAPIQQHGGTRRPSKAVCLP